MVEQSESRLFEGLEVPCHIGIIMDGNGRWAKERGLPRNMGHRAGSEALKGLLESAVEIGVRELTVYAFSTENWSRPRDEVSGIMMLLDYFFKRELNRLYRGGIRIRQWGRSDGIDQARLQMIRDAELKTKDNNRLTLNAAFNYGGRAEIVDAVRAIVREGIPADEIDEATINRHLYSAGSPDPDLIIRTGGENRLSNFLIWQASYAEIYSTRAYWPDFDREELLAAIRAYNQRERRYGGVSSVGS